MMTLRWSVFYGECNAKSKGWSYKGRILIRGVGCTLLFTFSNKQLCARVLALEYSDEDEIDKYHVEWVNPCTALYAAGAANNLPEKSQSRAERSGRR